MSSVLKEIENLTNQSNLSFGISDMSDAELLLQSLPNNVKDDVKRRLALNTSTTDAELARLIIDNINNIEETRVSIDFGDDDLDIQSMNPFEGDAEGQSSINLNIEDILDNPDLQDSNIKSMQSQSDSEGDGEGEGEGEGDGEGEGEGEGDEGDEGEGDGEGEGEGEGDEGDEGEGDGEGEGEGEGDEGDEGDDSDSDSSMQNRIENELLDFGYQPLYPYFGEIINEGVMDDFSTSKEYNLIKKTEYVEILNTLRVSENYMHQELQIFNTDFNVLFNLTVMFSSTDKNFHVINEFRFTQSKNNEIDFTEFNNSTVKIVVSDGRTEYSLYESQQDVKPYDFTNKLNEHYKKFMTLINKALISEAEVNQKFLQNINE